MSESIYALGTNCCMICGGSTAKDDRDAHQEWHERGFKVKPFKDYTRSGVLERLRDVLDAD